MVARAYRAWLGAVPRRSARARAVMARSHRARSNAELIDWLEAMRAQGGGLFQLAVVSPLNLQPFIDALVAGDEDALRTREAVNRALRMLNSVTRPSKEAPMCLFCDAVLWRECVPHAIAVMTPCCDEPARGMFNFVCRDCVERFADADALRAALLAYYRRSIAPDLRVLPLITSPPGHA
jgi:hypothetical protein